MSKPLRVLVVEDSEDDALLMIHALKKGGYDPEYERVEDAEAMRKFLETESWDVILCDYQMPKFDGPAAIALLKETGIDVPLIIVSGAIGEDMAAECMRLGACDFFIKGKLPRLAFAIERELKEAESRDQHKRAEKALRESEQYFRAIIQNASDIILVVDRLGTITYASPSSKRFLGYAPDELIGKSSLDLIVSEDKQRAMQDFGKASQTKEVAIPNFFRIRHKDGSERVLEGIGKNLLDDPSIAGFVMNIRDITDRKRTEEEKVILAEIGRVVGSTLEIEDLYKRMTAEIRKLIPFDSLRVNLFNAKQKTLNVVYVSGLEIPDRRMGESYPLRGTIFEEVIRTKRGMIIQSENIEGLLNKFPSLIVAVQVGIRSIMNLPLIAQNELIGSLVIRSKKPAAYTEQDLHLAERIGMQIAGPIVNAQLFTELQKTETSLRESEGRFRSLFEQAAVGVAEIEISTSRFITVNRRLCEMVGRTEEEMLATTFHAITHPEDSSLDEEKRALLLAGKIRQYSRVKRYLRKDGKSIWVNIMVSSLGKPGEKSGRNMIVVEDITERKKAEETLRENEARYRAVNQSANDAIITVNSRGTIMGWNLSAERIFGYPEAEVLGQPLDLIVPHKFRERHREGMKLVQAGGEHRVIGKTVELVGLHKNGSEFPLELSLSEWEISGGHFYTGIIRDITNRKQVEEQLQDTLESLRKAVGTTIHVLAYTVETRDPYTAGHQTRSADLARGIATEMGLPKEKIDAIRIAGSIHDIGKLSVPAEILSKPTKLSEIEYSLIKEHARQGYEMLKDVESPWPLAEIVYQHHERMDGSGYPRNLKGEDICMEARILAVADVVEAMASHRPYRPGLGIEVALDEIEKNRGICYDKTVADACLRLFREKGFQLVGT